MPSGNVARIASVWKPSTIAPAGASARTSVQYRRRVSVVFIGVPSSSAAIFVASLFGSKTCAIATKASPGRTVWNRRGESTAIACGSPNAL